MVDSREFFNGYKKAESAQLERYQRPPADPLAGMNRSIDKLKLRPAPIPTLFTIDVRGWRAELFEDRWFLAGMFLGASVVFGIFALIMLNLSSVMGMIFDK